MKISTTTLNSNYTLQSNFANLAGEIAESFAFSRTVGQIYGFLYASPHPVSLDEIAKGVGISKSNASINLRTLEDWDAVKPVWVKGTRRDYYEANHNLKGLILCRVKEGITKRIDKFSFSLDKFTNYLKTTAVKNEVEPKFLQDRLTELEELLKRSQKILTLLPQIEKFL